jgi:Protein of unknown function (DUF3383)
MSQTTIPASFFAGVNPSVLNAGGNALDLVAVFLTENTRVPIGTVPSFPSQSAVAAYFGATSAEAVAAGVYFLGYNNKTATPGALLFSQYPVAAVPAYLRGGSIPFSLTQMQASSGTLTLTIDGAPITSSSISLAAATSFSNAATLIQAGFTSPGFTVAFDSVSNAFVFTNTLAGASSTISFATGPLMPALLLSQATGAVISPGAAAATPAAAMAAITAQTMNWASFTHLFNPDTGGSNVNKLAFAAWSNSQNNRFLYVPWDNDITPTQSTDAASSLGQLIIAAGYSGVAPAYDPTNLYLAPMICGFGASIDFTALNGRTTFAFRSQSGITPPPNNATEAANLIANGYNFYAPVATANQPFQFLYPGSVSGQYQWIDSYFNQIWLTNQFQLAMMQALTQLKSIPYDVPGYALIRAFLQDPIKAAGDFGVYRTGVTLSSAQAAEVNSAAGLAIDSVLSAQGQYLQILDAPPQVRQARGSPVINFWYMDGESVQSLSLNSTLLQ